jgi:hypothetical protein
MKLLSKYQNGNIKVTLFDNGTKIQEWPDNELPAPIYFNSCDIKITNKCNLGCRWCHEMSVPNGAHGDLKYLFEILKDLPSGTELAIGGGDPLTHPDLLDFLESCKSIGLIPNMTVNGKHVLQYIDDINYLIDNKLIYGLGVSVEDDFDFTILNKINHTSNVVLHVIAGVNSLSIFDIIQSSSIVQKVLILGYKEVGRGIKFHNEEVESNLLHWKNNLKTYIRKIHLSFDNLALSQLDIKQYLTDEEWSEFYCGADGVFTMYIDAIKKEFAMSSTSPIRYPLKGDVISIFKTIRDEKI